MIDHSAKLRLYSAWYCPFAQRTWMALIHTGVAFDYVEIDPYQKTEEWMAISRGTGQVPVLDGPGVIVPDSLRTLEYIDTFASNPAAPLYPADPAARADVKYWTDFLGRGVISPFYRFLKADPNGPGSDSARIALEAGLTTLTGGMTKDGPFFSGSDINAVDIAFVPFALRIEILLSHYRHYSLPDSGPLGTRFRGWWEAMRNRPSLVATSTGLDDYAQRLIGFYLPYSQGGGQVVE